MKKRYKGYYIVFGDDLNDITIGENRKVLAQIQAFNNAGIEFSTWQIPIEVDSAKTKLWSRLPFTNCVPIWKYDVELGKADYIYMRRPPYLNIHMYLTLKKLRTDNPNIKILMEIPTYPYDKEMVYRTDHMPFNYPFLWKDKFWRNYIHKVVDLIVTPSEPTETSIWGCPVLTIGNGIILEDYQVRNPVVDDTIDLLAIANFKEWHGYERIIDSLHRYYISSSNVRDIKLHMVGGGTELVLYKELAKKYALNDRIFFYGKKALSELGDLYNVADIGLCSFGAYKKDLFLSKELKSREYLAKGLPIISGCELDILKNGDEGYLLLPNDSTAIDMEKIINFYDDVYGNNTKIDVAKKMRCIADKKLEMGYCMKTVIDFMTKNDDK